MVGQLSVQGSRPNRGREFYDCGVRCRLKVKMLNTVTEVRRCVVIVVYMQEYTLFRNTDPFGFQHVGTPVGGARVSESD